MTAVDDLEIPCKGQPVTLGYENKLTNGKYRRIEWKRQNPCRSPV